MSLDNLYEETPATEQPLYTAEDTVSPVDTTVGNYSVLKSIGQIVTNQAPPDEVNFAIPSWIGHQHPCFDPWSPPWVTMFETVSVNF